MFKNILIFVAGAALGSYVTYKFIYNKAYENAYNEIAEKKRKEREDELKKLNEETLEMLDEIKRQEAEEAARKSSEDIYDDYDRDEDDDFEEDDNGELYFDPTLPDDVMDERIRRFAEQMAIDEGYKKAKENDMIISEPYVIPPETLGDCGYKQVDLMWFKDGIVTDIYDNIIDNLEELLGREAFDHFDEYEDPDIACFRNDKLELDIEMSREPVTYEEAYGKE